MTSDEWALGSASSRVLEDFYASLLDESLFLPALGRLGGLVGGSAGTLMREPEEGRGVPQCIGIVSPDVDATAGMWRAYDEHYYAFDPTPAVVRALAPGDWFADTRQWDPAARARSPYAQEFIAGHGYDGWATVRFGSPDGWALAVLREAGSPDFSEARLAAGARLLPHLARVLQLREHMEELRDMAHTGLAALEQFAMPVWVVERDGCIRHANRRGEEALSSPAAVLVGRRRCLRPAAFELEAVFRNMLDRACGPAPRLGGALACVGRAGEKRVLRVLPLAGRPECLGSLAQNGAHLALVIEHGGAAPAIGEILATLYGFTRAEARVAEGLLLDRTPEEIAALAGTKISTLRTQLKSMLAKTDCRRQTELVRLLASLALVRAPEV